jgi:hypothetical protein
MMLPGVTRDPHRPAGPYQRDAARGCRRRHHPASCGLDGEDIEALGDLLTPENGIPFDDDNPPDQHV